jgi:hypothetical protein
MVYCRAADRRAEARHGTHPIVEVIDNDKYDVGSFIDGGSSWAALDNQKEQGNQV